MPKKKVENKTLYNILQLLFGIVLAFLTIYWALTSNNRFLLMFSLIWWVQIFYLAVNWMIMGASGKRQSWWKGLVGISMVLALIFLALTPYFKKFFLWGVHITRCNAVDLYLMLLIFILVVGVLGLLWLIVAHLRMTYLELSGKELTFVEQLKIIAVVIGMFLFMVLMLKVFQLVGVRLG